MMRSSCVMAALVAMVITWSFAVIPPGVIPVTCPVSLRMPAQRSKALVSVDIA